MSKKSNIYLRVEYTPHNLPLDLPIVPLSWKTADQPITFLHFHNCIEIGYCYSGSGIIRVENKVLPFETGDISIICPNTMHLSQSNQGLESTWEYLYIDPNLLLKDFFPAGFPNAECLMHDSKEFKNIIKRNDSSKIQFLVLNMLEEIRSKKENYSASIKGLCLALMMELTRLNPIKSEGRESKSEGGRIIVPALEYIHQHYMDKLKVETLANCCHLSITHFRRTFQGVMGMSPLEYLNHIRIRKSCELLYHTDESILNVSLLSGFPTVSSYNRHFHKAIGVSPLKWRSNVRFMHQKDVIPLA